MQEKEKLAIYYGKIEAVYEIIKNMPPEFKYIRHGDIIYDCNSEEKKIGKLLEDSALSLATVLDYLAQYIWKTHVAEIQARCAEDAISLAEYGSRDEFGKVLKILCVERLPTEYETKILWRITMQLPEEDNENVV